MLELIATWNPTKQLWEKDQTDLFFERREPFSETWPKWGMTRNGQLLPLPKSAHPTTASGSSLLPTPTTRDHKGQNQRNDDSCLHGALLSTPQARDSKGAPKDKFNNACLPRDIIDCEDAWGKYEEAVLRWERLTRPAPNPTEPGVSGMKRPRINPAFSEWMMGWAPGWCTDPEIGIGRIDQLRIIGNGVCPQQAEAALTLLLGRIREQSAGEFYENHFPWYVDSSDTDNIDCDCGAACDGVGGWATHMAQICGGRAS